MGIEWSLGKIKSQVVDVPLTTMTDYYMSKGFKVIDIVFGYKHIGDFHAHIGDEDPTFFDKYPYAKRCERVGNTELYRYEDKSKHVSLRVSLEKV